MVHHAPKDYVCPFCGLVKGIDNKAVLSEKSDLVYHNPKISALISLHQWRTNPGNVIIFPNQHFENIFDLPAEYAIEIHIASREIALAMKAVYQCDGISTRQHNEPAGNQDVWHYHLHVTPRYTGDQLYLTRPEIMPAAERARLALKLREYLAK